MKKKNVFVSPNGGKGWNVKYDGENIANFNTQKEAMDQARIIAKIYETERVIQGKNGKIRSKDSYGPDPRKIKG